MNQWDLRTKKYGFRVYPCPETPFSVEWDAFRDWHYFEIKWGNDPSDWNMQSNITGNGSNQVPPDNNIAINADVIWSIQTGLNLVDVASSILFDIGYLSDSFWPTSKYYAQGISLECFIYSCKICSLVSVYIIHAVYESHIFKNMIWSQFKNRICVFLIYLKDFWDMAHMGFHIDAFSLSLLELNWTYRHCICKNC